nr:unnamed protein product [Callosobruchus chinensis]
MSSKQCRVLRGVAGWRALNFKFVSLGIKIERAIAFIVGICILPKSEDNYRKIISLFKEEKVPHRTFPLRSERNIHAVFRGIPATFLEQQIRKNLNRRATLLIILFASSVVVAWLCLWR